MVRLTALSSRGKTHTFFKAKTKNKMAKQEFKVGETVTTSSGLKVYLLREESKKEFLGIVTTKGEYYGKAMLVSKNNISKSKN